MGERGFFALDKGFVDAGVGGGGGGGTDEADYLGDGGVGAEKGEEVCAEGAGGACKDLPGALGGFGYAKGYLPPLVHPNYG